MADIRDGQQVIHVPAFLVREVRDLLGDNEEENELVESGRSWSDEKLALFIVDVINDFNVAKPEVPQRLTLDGLLTGTYSTAKPHIIDAAISRALRYEATRRMRNALPYQAGSINYDPNAVWQNMLAMSDRLWAEWTEWRNGKKVEINVGNGFGLGGGGYAASHSDLLTRTAYDQGNVVTVVGTLL